MNKLKIAPQKIILLFSCLLFGIFLLLPMATILCISVFGESGVTLEFYGKLFAEGTIFKSFLNSVLISAASGIITTTLAFIPAYAVNYTNIPKKLKKLITTLVMIPMLLPTITYGFAIIYSLGKQGMITKLLGFQLVDIYGVPGLIIGYVIYTLPISFMLINNTMGFVDKKFSIVSRLMGDNPVKCFLRTVITPLISTLAISFIQSFTLSFTDYGIPAALAGNIDLVSNQLYNAMLGSLPDFNSGSTISIIMLIPSVLSIILISILNKHNIRYNKISLVEIEKNKVRDIFLGIVSGLIIFCILSVFVVIFIMPFIEQWPYRMNFSLEHVLSILGDSSLIEVYLNSLLVALATSILGTLVVYGTALVAARRGVHRHLGKIPNAISLITNTIPGMVLGVGYLLTFKGTFVHNTFAILVICNVVHYYSSPYLMMKSSLEKLNASWETTAKLLGDNWLKTIVRIITPNALSTLLEAFSYYFVNSMVTVSAVIFLVSTRTMVITTKIKELQHFANFNEIFVLSILILLTNLAIKGLVRLFAIIQNKRHERKRSV